MQVFLQAALVCALAAVGPALAQQSAAKAAPLRIGLVAPLTGGSSDIGNSARLGAELAVKEINEIGGFLGRPLELVIRDDQSKPDIGRTVAENLVNEEKVAYTIGYCNAGVAMKSIEVFQKAQHVLMVPCSTGTGVISTYPAKDSFIFRLTSSDTITAKFLVNEIVKRRKLSKVAILADNTGYGTGGLNDITKELEKLQLKPVSVQRFDLKVADLTPAMRAAKEAGADAVVVYSVGPEQGAAVKARFNMGWKVPYFAPWTLSIRSVTEYASPEMLEGTSMAQTIIRDQTNERKSSFIARYFHFSKEGKMAGSLMAAAQSYDAVHLMLRAAFQTKKDLSGVGLKSALENLKIPYQGVVTTYKMPYSDADHEAFSQNMIWLGVWRGGEIGFYHAEDAKLSAQVRRKE
jgi:branched-chain amino acid transport system substrate-binding protein